MMSPVALGLLLFVLPQAAAEPRPLAWGDFPVFVWRDEHKGELLPAELVAPFGGMILMRGEDSNAARERGLAYLVWNVAGREPLHLDADEAWQRRVEAWIETRDEGLLVRTPCLNDPATRARLFATLDATLARHGEFPGAGLVLGDEVSLTPNGDPFDLCRCGFCETKWKTFAEVEGWPARAPLTDEVLAALREGRTEAVGPWLARRRFEQESVQELLLALAARARTGRKLELALLGIKDRTAFGGLDLAALWQGFDVLEAYEVGCARPLAETLRNRYPSGPLRAQHTAHEATLATLFLADESPAGAAWLAWDAWLSGADGLVLWSDRELARAPAVRARLAEAVADIRALERRFQERLRGSMGGLALLSDGDATAFAWLLDAEQDGASWPRRRAGYQETHGSREQRLRAWREACRALGRDLGAVPLALLRDRERAPSTLVLVDARVLDPADVSELERYLEHGGRLLVEGELARIDRRGRPWKESVLAGLEARHGARVRRVEPDFLVARRRESVAEWRGRLDAFLADEGTRRTFDYELRGKTAEERWLQRRQWARWDSCGFVAGLTPELVALLPEARDAEERKNLVPRRVEVDAHAATLEWIHPPAGEALRPGDAAVFVLHPQADAAPR